MNYALSAYPVSQAFQTQLSMVLGESVQFMLLSELRAQQPRLLWSCLRALRPKRFFLLLEDESSRVLLPILQMIAMVARPQHMVVVDAHLAMQRVTLPQVLQSFFRLIKATLLARYAYICSRKKARALLKAPGVRVTKQLDDAQRMLYLNANLWFGVKAGGSVGHIAGVVNALYHKGLQVDYAAVDVSPLIDKEVHQFQLPLLSAFGMPSELNYYYFNALVVRFLSRLTSKHSWDFIYQRMSIANFSGAALSQQLNIPLVLEYNGSEAWIAKNWGRCLRYHDAAIEAEAVCLKQASVVVTISEVLKQELIERGVASEKIVCYPNCIDPLLFDPERFTPEDRIHLRAKHDIAPDATVLTFVGTFGQWHGVDILAQAIDTLIRDHETWLLTHKVHFLLVGDGSKMADVKRILGAGLHTSYVTLTGLIPQREAPAYLAASDILLSPHVANQDGSRFFGSPTKLFEYMAMGKAIIASDLEQIGEVLRPGLHAGDLPTRAPENHDRALGLLCEPGHVSQLLDAIQFLVENSSWRDLLGYHARCEALAHYTWEKHVAAFMNKKI